jgi:hypothetical protein
MNAEKAHSWIRGGDCPHVGADLCVCPESAHAGGRAHTQVRPYAMRTITAIRAIDFWGNELYT